jgi:membrane dipeptidase
MEGAEGIESVDELEEFYELGLRQVGPVWSGTRFCGGTHEDRPFDEEGRKLLEVMSSLKMGLDISHMRESAALIALDQFDGPVIASHANSRTLLKGRSEERHLTDRVIRMLQERGGCIGVVPYNKFLSTDWVLSSPQETVTINHIVAQIDYYCQMAGNSTLVAIGSDFDGGFGFPNIPYPMDTIKDLQLIKPALLAKGYSPQDVENIFNLNWKNHLERILPA